jgi:hypothetical protein
MVEIVDELVGDMEALVIGMACLLADGVSLEMAS